MANPYVETQQEYAKGAARAAGLVNGGAAVAVLSQLAELIALGMTESPAYCMGLFSLGVALATLSWAFGYLSTAQAAQAVETNFATTFVVAASRWEKVGVATFAASVMCFLLGVAALLCEYKAAVVS